MGAVLDNHSANGNHSGRCGAGAFSGDGMTPSMVLLVIVIAALAIYVERKEYGN